MIYLYVVVLVSLVTLSQTCKHVASFNYSVYHRAVLSSTVAFDFMLPTSLKREINTLTLVKML
jgi:hypothetical protein